MIDYIDGYIEITETATTTWASNQNLEECLLNPQIMMPVKMHLGKATFKQYRTFDTRAEALHSLENETILMSYKTGSEDIVDDIKNSASIKSIIVNTFSLVVLTVFTLPIIKLTQFRVEKMLKKSRYDNPEWWL